MQFTAAFLALAAFAVSQVAANASIVRQFNALGATDQGALHTCLNNYRTDNWVRPFPPSLTVLLVRMLTPWRGAM